MTALIVIMVGAIVIGIIGEVVLYRERNPKKKDD